MWAEECGMKRSFPTERGLSYKTLHHQHFLRTFDLIGNFGCEFLYIKRLNVGILREHLQRQRGGGVGASVAFDDMDAIVYATDKVRVE